MDILSSTFWGGLLLGLLVNFLSPFINKFVIESTSRFAKNVRVEIFRKNRKIVREARSLTTKKEFYRLETELQESLQRLNFAWLLMLAIVICRTLTSVIYGVNLIPIEATDVIDKIQIRKDIFSYFYLFLLIWCFRIVYGSCRHYEFIKAKYILVKCSGRF